MVSFYGGDVDKTSEVWYGRGEAAMFGGLCHGQVADGDKEVNVLLRSVSTAVLHVQGGTVHEYGLWTFFNGLAYLILQMYTLCGAFQRVSHRSEQEEEEPDCASRFDFKALAKGRVLAAQRESEFGWIRVMMHGSMADIQKIVTHWESCEQVLMQAAQETIYVVHDFVEDTVRRYCMTCHCSIGRFDDYCKLIGD